MHPNPAFRKATREQNLAFAQRIGFGMLTVPGDPWPLAAHVPFVAGDDGIELHLARSNPICRAAPAPALLAVSGVDAYISPDWYGVPDQVPTWNYIAVHLRGRLEPLPLETLRDHLDRLSDHFEAELAPKPIWKTAKMTPEVLDRMLRMILPFRLVVEDVQGTWKLSQNKPDDVRLAAADHVEDTVAALMQEPPC
ncbi:FMN-binding negative transcriptional regulator [Paracoccus sp. TK19116]|uniref:FMN-binding negative transcriptional regulator n=1 Tax=Paracoccus albicereus TaxID=2922394 RepID=A0ABT1MRV3_9RHOB|nr:FMN-binding negative transcriptional regulator [Paracoccus albicereus]MCQ0971040.1 FMN-binding negative transcriptional regulator [Paracoccus albicereus]